MARPLWEQILNEISAEIDAGRYAPGDKLPSEAALSARFGVNRHTVRRALGALSDQGRVYARRGAGVFVGFAPVDYRIGPQSRFTQNLTQTGHVGKRTILRLETLACTAEEAAVLELDAGAAVHLLESVGAADGVPLVYGHSTFPAERLPGFVDHLRETASITAALRASGAGEYRRLSTRITAERASGAIARHLRIPEGAPVLQTTALNAAEDGALVESGKAWFAAERIAFVVDGTTFG